MVLHNNSIVRISDAYDDNFDGDSVASRVLEIEKPRRSLALPLSPLFLIEGLSRKSFSYNKLPEEPLKLSVLKLDGSSFVIEVKKTATVAELKQAVETSFSHWPQKGPGKISWLHVWAHFCLCYNGQKLLEDSEYIKIYGIKDGDQLQFIRHVSISYNMIKKQSKKRIVAPKQQSMWHSPRTSREGKEIENNGENYNYRNIKNKNLPFVDRELIAPQDSKLTLGEFFAYSRLANVGESSPSRVTKNLFGSLKNIVKFASYKCYSRRSVLLLCYDKTYPPRDTRKDK